MRQQPQRVRPEAMAGRTIRFQGEFVIFALVFHLSPSTVEVPIDHLGAGALHIRHDKAGVDTLVGHCNLDDHAARTRPRPGLVTRRVEAGDLAPIAPRGSFGLFDHLPSQLFHNGIAGPSGHITEVGLGCDSLQHLGRGTVAVTAHNHQAFAHRQPLGTGETPGLEHGGEKAP